MAKVSIVIPFYKRIDFLIEAIDSVLRQTFQQFEIIIVNDGSKEDLSCLEKVLLDERIKLIKQVNKGPASARNRGVLEARGKYIFFLDSDDLFHPEKLRLQYEFMEENPQLAMSYTNYQLIDEAGSKIRDFKIKKAQRSYQSYFLRCPIATPTVCVKREIICEHLFPEDLRVGEDNLTWVSIAKRDSIDLISETLSSVRIGENTTAYDLKNYIRNNWGIITYSNVPFYLKLTRLFLVFVSFFLRWIKSKKASL